jgi:hypothetical protein
VADLVEGNVTSERVAIAGRYLGLEDGERFAAERRSRPGVLLRLVSDGPRVWDLSGILPSCSALDSIDRPAVRVACGWVNGELLALESDSCWKVPDRPSDHGGGRWASRWELRPSDPDRKVAHGSVGLHGSVWSFPWSFPLP